MHDEPLKRSAGYKVFCDCVYDTFEHFWNTDRYNEISGYPNIFGKSGERKGLAQFTVKYLKDSMCTHKET